MRAIGPEASAIIGPAQLVIASVRILLHLSMLIIKFFLKGSKVSKLEEILFPHPAISESVQECARMFAGRSIMKPQCFVKLLRLDTVNPTGNQATEKQKRKPIVPTYK